MDMMSEPVESAFKEKVRATAYPTFEGAGLCLGLHGAVAPGTPEA